MLGDGTLTKYFLRIFGDKTFDLPYFLYLAYSIKNLFGVDSHISTTPRGLSLTVCSVKICAFLNQEYNLPFGNKIEKKAKIPEEIMASSDLLNACLRGLIDTDGFVGKSGERLKVVFTSKNLILIEQVTKSLVQLNLLQKMSIKEYTEITSQQSTSNYFKFIGSSNLRHIIRFREYKENGNLLYKRETLSYYQKYEKMGLPYFGLVV
ncbi:LAGLIDADG family homing endonuclease [Candidatus Woesearchaeota archaeon]|nr:LAGLIDADG family homing endonuclease [Candidatus Woesearchaeota archaeon]